MQSPRIAVGIFSAGLVVLGADVVWGQDYPNRTIRIVTTGLGSGADSTSRLIAQGISVPLGQPVVVENRGGGVVPGDTVAKSAPDGYTFLVTGSSFFIGPLLQKAPYDPVKDFLPVSLMGSQPLVLVVHPALPVKSVKELIALAKARPGALNYSSTGTGGASHLAMELLKSMAGVDIVRIAYKNNTTEIADLISGQVQLTIGGAATVDSVIKSGRVRALAVASAEPSALLPGLPTVAASGVPGYESIAMTSMFAPANTPSAIINRVNQEVVRVLNRPDVKERLFNTGLEVVAGSPEQLANKMKSEMARMAKVIKDAGIRAD